MRIISSVIYSIYSLLNCFLYIPRKFYTFTHSAISKYFLCFRSNNAKTEIMIESCSPRCMLLSIIFLGGITFLLLIFESHWTSVNNRPGFDLLEKNLSLPLEACWRNEQFTIVKPCQPCTDFEIKSKSVNVCAKTHFKEAVKCLNSNHEVYRSCEKVAWLEEKRFWIFEILMATSSLLSTCFVFLRQRILDHRLMRKIQKQLANSV